MLVCPPDSRRPVRQRKGVAFSVLGHGHTISVYLSSFLDDELSNDNDRGMHTVPIPEQALIDHSVTHNDDENMYSVQSLQAEPVLTEPDQLN